MSKTKHTIGNQEEIPSELGAIIRTSVNVHDYKLKALNPKNYVAILHRDNGETKINIYWKKRFRGLFTVQTTIDHPTKGRNQLNRAHLSEFEVMSIIANPRVHTSQGYRKIKDKK